jgi:putative endonuclease
VGRLVGHCPTDFLNFVPRYLLLVIVKIILIVHCAWIYILTNDRHTVLYVGVTNNLATRLWEHRSQSDQRSFTARYNVCKLIYYEGFNSIVEAIAREKLIKGKSRKWKEALIQQVNPEWIDLTRVVASL